MITKNGWTFPITAPISYDESSRWYNERCFQQYNSKIKKSGIRFISQSKTALERIRKDEGIRGEIENYYKV